MSVNFPPVPREVTRLLVPQYCPWVVPDLQRQPLALQARASRTLPSSAFGSAIALATANMAVMTVKMPLSCMVTIDERFDSVCSLFLATAMLDPESRGHYIDECTEKLIDRKRQGEEIYIFSTDISVG